MIEIIIILGLLAGYREVQILCDRGSWYYMNFRNWFWFTNQADKKKSWRDSFHVSNGLYVLILFEWAVKYLPQIGLAQYLGDFVHYQLNVLVYWVGYFWIRNIIMHVVLPYKPQWKYLSPIHF